MRDSAGKYHLVYESGGEIYCQYSTDGVNTWLGLTRLSPGTGNRKYPCIAERSGNLYVVWQLYYSNSHYIYFCRSTSGGLGWSSAKVIASNVGSIDPLPVIASPATNELMVVYRGGNNLRWKRSTDDGGTWPILGTITAGSDGNSNSPSLTATRLPSAAVHQKGCQMVDQIYRVPIPQKADLVLVSCGGHPKDINFIQAHKAIQHGFYAVKPGGTLIILAQCPEGIGSESFLEWFDYPDITTTHQALLENFKINGNTALSLRQKTSQAHLILVSDLNQEVVQKMGMIPATTMEDAYHQALKFLPENYQIIVIPNGSLTVPWLEEMSHSAL